MSKAVRSRRQIFGVPALLAAVTLVALVLGLVGGAGLWWLAWAGTAAPLVVAAFCCRRSKN